jgi:hypothetical protein
MKEYAMASNGNLDRSRKPSLLVALAVAGLLVSGGSALAAETGTDDMGEGIGIALGSKPGQSGGTSATVWASELGSKPSASGGTTATV